MLSKLPKVNDVAKLKSKLKNCESCWLAIADYFESYESLNSEQCWQIIVPELLNNEKVLDEYEKLAASDNDTKPLDYEMMMKASSEIWCFINMNEENDISETDIDSVVFNTPVKKLIKDLIY